MFRRTALALALSATFVAAPVAANEVLHWNRVAADAAAAAETDPLTESRVFAIVHLAIHDALNAIDHRYEPYRLRMSAPGASPEAAVAAAAHATLVELMPKARQTFDTSFADAIGAIPDSDAKKRGIETGRRAAAALLAARKNDGAERVIAHRAGTKPGEYRPTPPDFTPAAFAQWGNVKPFALPAAAQFRPASPYAPTSAMARNELEQVKLIGAKDSTTRTAEQSEIARYWYENSTQGWNRVTREVASARGLDRWENARLFALVHVAMADGFIGGFEAKYHYNYWRPASAIRANGGAAWLSELWTPPVPDHPSTHTVLGAAAAAVLTRYFGTDYVSFKMTSGAPYADITREFWGFSQAARENGASRVFAGIHFPHAVETGYIQGERIGAWAYQRVLKPVAPATGITALLQ
jgi:hypothetical protein